MNVGQLLDSSLSSEYQHQLNREVVGILFWLVPVLLVGLYFALWPLLIRRRINNYTVLTLVKSLGLIIAFGVVGAFAGFMLSFGSCFGSNCSSGQELWPFILCTLAGLATGYISVRRSILRPVHPATKPTEQVLDRENIRRRVILGTCIVIFSLLIAGIILRGDVREAQINDQVDRTCTSQYRKMLADRSRADPYADLRACERAVRNQ